MILFLAQGRPSYLQDVVYHGLATLLGSENVVEYPPNPRYHGVPDEGVPFRALYFDFPDPARAELRDLVGAADAIVVGSLNDDVIPHVREVLAMRPRPIVAYLDADDSPYVRGVVDHVDVYFKRETFLRPNRLWARMPARRIYHARNYPDRWGDELRREVGISHRWTRRTVPLPYAMVDHGIVPPAEWEYDVAFFGSPSHPIRQRVFDAMAELEAEGVRVLLGVAERRTVKNWFAYLDLLGRSRIGISVRGAGFDTFRYWEIPYAGSLLLAEKPRIVIPRNFEDGREAVFAEPRAMAATVRRLLDEGTDEIAARGREALLARHLSVHRAATVLDALGVQ